MKISAQANLWTEYRPTPEQVEYMIFPRISAIAELVWTNNQNKYYNNFLERMKLQNKRFDALNINYFRKQEAM